MDYLADARRCRGKDTLRTDTDDPKRTFTSTLSGQNSDEPVPQTLSECVTLSPLLVECLLYRRRTFLEAAERLGRAAKDIFSETTTYHLRCLFDSSFPRSLERRNKCAPLPNLPCTCLYCTDWDCMLRLRRLMIYVVGGRTYGEGSRTRWDECMWEFSQSGRSKSSRQVAAEQVL